MALKESSEKKIARMCFKRLKAKMNVSDEEMELIKKYYPFMR